LTLVLHFHYSGKMETKQVVQALSALAQESRSVVSIVNSSQRWYEQGAA
jgi:hypothetical protein